MFALSDYDYDLPESAIAQRPAARRDRSRLLVLERAGGALGHHRFSEIPGLLRPGDLLVVNNTQVIPARLYGRKETGGQVEVLLLDFPGRTRERRDPKTFTCDCLVKASKQPKPGAMIRFQEDLKAEVMRTKDAVCTLKFRSPGNFEAILQRIGQMPLPPYIRRGDGDPLGADRTDYQTVYASHKGAIAAPTAGLHFTRPLLRRLQQEGIEIAAVTLHVGYGTFLPVRVSDIRDHRMHAERYAITRVTADAINRARESGRRIVAVGTTSVRTLEHAADPRGRVDSGGGACDLFIYPGYRFKMVDALLTNFHLPRSTLLMLVSAFAGRDRILDAYREAIGYGYRFYSYGDAMLIV